jgi:hypothetical protein
LWIHARRFTNESRQPGGFRFVVSSCAVFDRYLRFHARASSMRPRLFLPTCAVEAAPGFTR